MQESFAVISGSIKDDTDIKIITEIAKDRYAEYKTAHHEWIDKVDNIKYRQALNKVRTDPDIFSKMKQKFPNSTIKPITEVDEIYWAVSPKGATGSDRSLVDCHYDSPFSLIPTGGVIFYRVIIACNENNTVTTVFPDENVRVKMGPKDFHGLDYNKDIHCVEGTIPEGKFRILLKLHYLIVPDGTSYYEPFVKGINVGWTVLSRETMRMSANPKNVWECIVALIVNICRIIFNNCYLFFLILLFIVLSYMFIGIKKKRKIYKLFMTYLQ
jgi:hypothetical protein